MRETFFNISYTMSFCAVIVCQSVWQPTETRIDFSSHTNARHSTGTTPAFIKAFFSGIAKYFRDTRSEMKKVVWPSRKQVINNTIVVCVVVLISALVVLLLDFVFGLGMDLLLTAGA